MARTDDRYRESFFPVLFHQEFLTRDLVPRILPVRIGKRRSFGDHVISGKLVIGRRGAYVHKLLCLAVKEPVVALELLGYKADKIAYGVKFHAVDLGRNRCLVIDVDRDEVNILREHVIPAAPVNEIKLVASLGKSLGDGRAYRSGSADE